MSAKSQQKELDELLLDEAAQLELEAQQEIPYIVTYRDDADLSKKLDIPRSVDGLVNLVEEKKSLEQVVKALDEKEYDGWLPGLCGLTSGAIAAVPVFASMIYYVLHTRLVGDVKVTAIIVGGSILTATAALTAEYYGRKLGQRIQGKFSKKKEFDQEKANQLQTKQDELKIVKQKLSYYQTHYKLHDLILVQDELGYSLGKVIQNSKEELVLRRTYHKLNRNVPEAMDNRQWEEYSEEKMINKDDIVSTLKYSTQLSADDLRHLEEGTPVVCHSTELLTDRPAYHFSDYGFIDKKNTDWFFGLRTLREFQGPAEHWLKYETVEDGKVNAYLLAPVIKPRIF